MAKEIYIRADGGLEIGLGHLVRCLAFAYMLKKNFTISFFVKEIPDKISEEIIMAGFTVNKINKEEEFFKNLTGKEIVVLDHYGSDSCYQKKIKEIGSKLVCIDDLHDKEFYADLIINHAPGIKPEDYKAQTYTQFALGLDYALLRPGFLEAAKQNRNTREIENLFICFGGSDYNNYTAAVLKAAMALDNFKKITVILGHAFKSLKLVEELGGKDDRVNIHFGLDEKTMVAVMKEADVAVVPASGILMEAFATGCKVISGMYVSNQAHVYENYKSRHLFVDAKYFEERNIVKAFNILNEQAPPEKIIDGESGERIRRLFKSFLTEQDVQIREATIGDLKLTYSWAANKKIRQHSFAKNIISYEEHIVWFSRKMKDPNCIYLIAEENGAPMGSLRYDLSDETAVISYLIDPTCQGRGMGMVLLRKGLSFLKTYPSGIAVVVGYVKPENIASQKSFKRLGYFEEYQKKEDKFKYSKRLL